MEHKKLCRALALLLAAVCLCGAALAAGGDEEDPLVSLSYLTQTVLPDIFSQVDARAEVRQAELEERFAQALSESGAGSDGQSAVFTLVTLSQGQAVRLDLGCELMLRIGSARVTADSVPALVDGTSGTTIGNGAELAVNHLYLATIAGRTVEAASGTVKLLLRGPYELL